MSGLSPRAAAGDAGTLQNRDDEGGRWVTIQGRPVFIKEGESLDEALAGKSDGKGDKTPENKGDSASKDAKKNSTSEPRNAKLKEQNERARPGRRSDGAVQAEHSGDHSPAPIRDAIHAGAGEKASGLRAQGDEAGDQLAASAERQAGALKQLYERDPSSRVVFDSTKAFGAGAEHKVQLSADGTHVLKFTTGEKFGVTMAGFKAPFADAADLRDATAGEYVDRLNLINEHFDTDFKVEGVHKTDGAVGLVVSQTFYKGEHPPQTEIDARMKGLGFVKLKPDNIVNTYIEDKAWYHPKSGVIVADTKPDNFIKDQVTKELVPIDLVIAKPAPGSTLHKAMLTNLKSQGIKNRAGAPSVAATLAADLAPLRERLVAMAVGAAKQSQSYLKAIEDIASRARWLASKRGAACRPEAGPLPRHCRRFARTEFRAASRPAVWVKR